MLTVESFHDDFRVFFKLIQCESHVALIQPYSLLDFIRVKFHRYVLRWKVKFDEKVDY